MGNRYMCTPECHLLKVRMSIYRIFHGKCARTVRTVFTHELLMYQKSNERAQRTSEISDTTFVVVLSALFNFLRRR